VTSFQRGPLAAGLYSFRAHFTPDDATGFLASTGDCEPLRVVDANIRITSDGVNRVGQPHTFTGVLKVNDGTGEVNAPNGTTISFTITSNGSSTPAGSCVTAGNTGSCSISLTSALTGVWSVRASATALNVTRSTNGVAPNSGPAVKRWVDAKIAIAPNAVNAIGDPHTFVATLSKDTSNGSGFVPAAGEHVTVTLADSLGASSVVDAAASTCDNAGANTNAAGQCTLVIRSATPGKVTAHASSTLSVAGSAPFTVETNGTAPNSGDAVKTYVDANIQITPQLQTNPVGSPHVFTAHVNVNPGTGFVNAPNGTQIGFSIVSGPGTLAQSSCVTSANTGSCQVTLNSAAPGTTVVRASVTTTVNTVSLTRVTDGTGGSSGPATKLWADAGVRTDIHNTAHGVILTANAGDVVHDKVFVTKASGTPASVPNPTSSVVFQRYSTINCTGSSVKQTVTLSNGTGETGTTTVTGEMSYRAEYLGNSLYDPAWGPCEPLKIETKCPDRRTSGVKTGGGGVRLLAVS
jgi:hypothetical protein